MRTYAKLAWSFIGIGAFILGFSRPVLARTKQASPQGPTLQEYQQRLEELEQKQKILERKLELKEEQEKEKAKEKPVVKASTSGISISSADGNNEIRFRGLIQGDARFYLFRDGFGAVNTFVLRRLRPYIEGKFAKHWEFRFMPDFGEGKVQLVDAYINTVIFPEFKIEVGKYKPSVGLERLESASNLHFAERGLPTNLVPNRDLGVMFHGDVLDGVFQYAVGGFNGVPDGGSADFDLDNAKDFAGRVFAHPFKKTSIEPLQGFGIGVSGTYGDSHGSEKNSQLGSYKSGGQQTFFQFLNDGTVAGTAVANGKRWRISPQGYYYYKGFGLLGEYVVSSQQVGLGAANAELRNKAWQVATSYVIGADNSYGAIKPRKPLGWKQGGAGAFEFLFRYNELHVDPASFPVFADPTKSAQNAKAWAVGFNWIINENAKLMLDFEQTHFNGGAKGGDRPTENALINRYQLFF